MSTEKKIKANPPFCTGVLKGGAVLFAVLILIIPCTVSVSAVDVPHMYSAKSLKEFTAIDNSICWVSNATQTEALNLNWDSNYADSFNVPYLLCTTPSNINFTNFYFGLDSQLPPKYNDTKDYYVKMPMVFLIVGTESTFYPSTSFTLKLHLNSGTVLEFNASDYSYYDGNRDRFCASFNFVVSGVILNNINSFTFHGYRTVAKKGPLRISIDGEMTIDDYDKSETYVDEIIESNIYTTNQLILHQEQMKEEEKQEANDTGNSATDGINAVIPDYSGNLISAISVITDPLRHENINCVFKLPSIKTPKFNGFIDEITLIEEKSINLENIVVEYIPNYIMLIVRTLLTCALLFFCYKELYGIIEYILTLKNGGY